jgi:nitroreductase
VEVTVDAMQAIYERRAVRSYTDRKVERATVLKLLDAAVQAPSHLNTQPWAFVVIEDPALLRRYSARAKAHALQSGKIDEPTRELLSTPELDLFHRAGTLIVICALRGRPEAVEECSLAAENLMLAATSLDLGTCPIGLARAFFQLPEVKTELGIPDDFTPVFPVTVGVPKVDTPAPPRDEARILCWKS